MNNSERLSLYQSDRFQNAVKIELLDWLGYWTSAGTATITEPLLKLQTEKAIYLILVALDDTTGKVAKMAISDSTIKSAESAEAVTDAMISSVVTAIMSFRLAWLTGVHSLEE